MHCILKLSTRYLTWADGNGFARPACHHWGLKPAASSFEQPSQMPLPSNNLLLYLGHFPLRCERGSCVWTQVPSGWHCLGKLWSFRRWSGGRASSFLDWPASCPYSALSLCGCRVFIQLLASVTVLALPDTSSCYDELYPFGTVSPNTLLLP